MTNETTKPVVTQADIGWATSAAQHLCHPADQDAAIRLLSDAFARHRLAPSPSEPSVVSQDLVPVACTDAHIGYVNKDAHGIVSFHMPAPTMSALPHGDTLLYPSSAIEAAQIAARNQALEEAAKVADDLDTFDRDVRISAAKAVVAFDIAAAINALRTPSQHQEEQ